MKNLYALAEFGKVTLREETIGHPGPGQVLLKAITTALSPGTERGIMEASEFPLPQRLGYAYYGEVIEIGENVQTLKVGDHVVATGQHQQYIILPEFICTPVPEGIAPEIAPFFNLCHTAMYGIRRSKIQLGESVLVLGQGIIGSLLAQQAKLAGACPVIVTGRTDKKLEFAKSLGIHHCINVRKDPDALKKLVDEIGGVDVVFEAAGDPSLLQEATTYVAERGRVMCMSSLHPGDSLDLRDLYMKGASFIGGYVNSKPFALKRYDLYIDPNNWPPKLDPQLRRFVSSDIWTSDEDIRTILKLMKYDMLKIKPYISKVWNYKDISEAYDCVWRKDPDMLGGLITWED